MESKVLKVDIVRKKIREFMIKRLMVCTVASIVLSGCTSIPWIGPLFTTKPVEHVEETIIADTAEATAAICGEDVHIEVDIDPKGDPKCMHCSLHCPTEKK